jgi:hypothetical protein
LAGDTGASLPTLSGQQQLIARALLKEIGQRFGYQRGMLVRDV